MRLSKINVKNFRLLREVSIRLDYKLSTTILVGPNNSGKTSMAEVLQLFVAGTGKSLSLSDFSLSCRKDFDKVQKRFIDQETDGLIESAESPKAFEKALPSISLALFFDYEDVSVDLSVVGDLLMDLDPQSYEVALQIDFEVKDVYKLKVDYLADREQDESLFDFLNARLHDYYALSYYKVEPITGERERLADRSLVERLIKINFVAAQRHIDDNESSQATRLSRLLHSHYQRRYKATKPEAYKELEKMLRTQSAELSGRYMQAFAALISSLMQFGYPQNRTPQLSIKAELNADTLFKDNTRVYYAAKVEAQVTEEEEDLSYDLPEKYNGLGFKNLIFMILQLKSFQEDLEQAMSARPLVHLIIIEEPEVHLHPQVQSIFIKQVSKFLNPEGTEGNAQLMLTTHSSHIVADCGFSPVRYFLRKGGAVEVKDLLQFENTPENDEEVKAIKFLAQYLTLTRCDLFFSDKVILIEGTVERLLLPKMIEKCAKGTNANLASDYISVLEVGGAYAHTFKSLIKFIEVPTLVITDLDSVGKDKRKCRVSDGHSSSNATLKKWLPGKSKLSELCCASETDKTDGPVQVTYQVPDEEHLPCGRSFEEAFIYCNADWILENQAQMIGTGESLEADSADDLRAKAYDIAVDKVDFALDLMVTDGWRTPKYIADGLAWLAKRGQQ